MLVPVVAHDRLVAVPSTVWCRPGRRYRPEDVGVTQEFARRAALALENALLYDVAQAAIRTRDQVLGFVAHDLRNPLGTIFTAAALLQRGGRAPGSRRPIDAIERAAIRMNRLIEDLLDVTRMEGGALAIEPTGVETRHAIADCLDAQKDLAASASLELRSDLEEDLPDVWADRDRLLQVFENLIGNAIKFTDPGGASSSELGREVETFISRSVTAGPESLTRRAAPLRPFLAGRQHGAPWRRSWTSHRQGNRRSAWRWNWVERRKARVVLSFSRSPRPPTPVRTCRLALPLTLGGMVAVGSRRRRRLHRRRRPALRSRWTRGAIRPAYMRRTQRSAGSTSRCETKDPTAPARSERRCTSSPTRGCRSRHPIQRTQAIALRPNEPYQLTTDHRISCRRQTTPEDGSRRSQPRCGADRGRVR